MVNVKPEVAARIQTLIPQFGAIGSPIPGSQYVRSYCGLCGEPMRVSGKLSPAVVGTCERCDGRHGQVAVPSSARVDEVSGYQANAIRALEGD